MHSNVIIFLAAACHVTRNGVKPENAEVLLGRFNLTNDKEQNWISHKIAEWKVHEEYSKTKKFHNIALIIVKESVEFTNFIQPICMPSADLSISGLTGIAVGYGKIETFADDYSDLPKESFVSTIDFSNCRKSFTNNDLSSSIQICANWTGEILCTGKKKIF